MPGKTAESAEDAEHFTSVPRPLSRRTLWCIA
jgi:hypothetical protein